MKKIFYLLILLLLATSGMAIATVKIINNPGSAQSLNIWGTSNEYRRELNITGIQYSSTDANTTRITFNWRGTTNSADDANHPYMHFMLTKGKTLIKDFYFGSIASSPSGTFTHDIPNANLSNGDILYVFMTFDGRPAERVLAEAPTLLPIPAAIPIGTVQVQTFVQEDVKDIVNNGVISSKTGHEITFHFDPKIHKIVHRSKTGEAKYLADIEINMVLLAGDFNKWGQIQENMKKNENGIYTITLSIAQCGGPGFHQFKYIVNNEWWVEPTEIYPEISRPVAKNKNTKNYFFKIESSGKEAILVPNTSVPDIEVLYLQTEKSSIRINEQTRLHAIIKNIGTCTTTPFTVNFYVSNVYEPYIGGKKISEPIAPGQMKTIGINYFFGNYGKYVFTVQVSGLSDEKNLDNNSKKVTIWISKY